MKNIIAVLPALLLIAACGGGPESRVKKGEIAKTMEQASDQGNLIEAIGIGAADQTLDNKTQKMATSRNAAIVAAQYEMLSMVKGLQLEGGITVEKAIETDSKLQTSIDAEIKGAEIVKTEWTNDDGCVVTIRLDKKRLEKMMGIKFK
ncbi:MAG: hypothetical protein AABZ44_10380 [Elusimicrobiota bacterium]